MKRKTTSVLVQGRTLSEIYRHHHSSGARLGFTFGGSAKGHQFAKWIGTGVRILDIGCRDGTLTSFYTEGNSVVGVDVDPDALNACHDKLAVKTVLHDISLGLPFGSASFDVVVCSEVLEHVAWPNSVVSEIARVLRPSGLFVGSVPNTFRLKNRLKFLLGNEFEVDPTHLRRYHIRSLTELLATSFDNIVILPAYGRLCRLHGGLFANTLMWRCERTRT